MTKSSIPFFGMALMVILSLIHRATKVVTALAPEGYEDEDGFHFDGASES